MSVGHYAHNFQLINKHSKRSQYSSQLKLDMRNYYVFNLIIISAGIPIHTSIDNYLRILCKPLFVTSLPILLSLKCTKKWAGTKLRLHQLNKNGNYCLLVYTNILYVLPTDWESCSRTPDFSRNVIIKVYNLLKSEFCIYWSHQQISQGLASPQGGYSVIWPI